MDSDSESSRDNGQTNSDLKKIYDSDSAPSSSSSSPKSSTQKSVPPKNFQTKKKSAWIDPSEVQPTALVSLLSGPTRLRKLRHGVDEDLITGKDYETRLRAQFERVNPEPAWAKKARGSKRKNKNKTWDESEDDQTEEDEEEDVNDIISSTAGILIDKTKTKKRGAVAIPSGTLSIERVRDANHSVQNSGSGEVRVLAFHPKPDVPVLCVATADRRVRLFNVSLLLKKSISNSINFLF